MCPNARAGFGDSSRRTRSCRRDSFQPLAGSSKQARSRLAAVARRESSRVCRMSGWDWILIEFDRELDAAMSTQLVAAWRVRYRWLRRRDVPIDAG